MRVLSFWLLMLMLCSCSAPPLPPSITPSTRRPANSAQALELQSCQHQLHNSLIRAQEASWDAESANVTRERLVVLQQAVAMLQARLESLQRPSTVASATGGSSGSANRTYILGFAFASARLDIPHSVSEQLLSDAMSSVLVMIRGRTDGNTDSPAASRLARDRAMAARAHLVAAGVPSERIRVTYQASGDHLAENAQSYGRQLNRRVEIETYRVIPKTISTQPSVERSPDSATSVNSLP